MGCYHWDGCRKHSKEWDLCSWPELWKWIQWSCCPPRSSTLSSNNFPSFLGMLPFRLVSCNVRFSRKLKFPIAGLIILPLINWTFVRFSATTPLVLVLVLVFALLHVAPIQWQMLLVLCQSINVLFLCNVWAIITPTLNCVLVRVRDPLPHSYLLPTHVSLVILVEVIWCTWHLSFVTLESQVLINTWVTEKQYFIRSTATQGIASSINTLPDYTPFQSYLRFTSLLRVHQLTSIPP